MDYNREMTSVDPISALRAALADDRRGLREAIELVPPGRRRERPGEGRWSVAEVLEHLAIVEERSVAIIAKLAADAPARSATASAPPTALDRTALRDRSRRVSAPEFIQPTGTIDADEAWARLERSRLELEVTIAAAADRDLTKVTRTHPALGPLDGYQSILAIAGHEERHAEQIREIARAFTTVSTERTTRPNV
jgi:hypothetical protein